jgi:glycosyltransferase involved in cell wall biosynthesis
LHHGKENPSLEWAKQNRKPFWQRPRQQSAEVLFPAVVQEGQLMNLAGGASRSAGLTLPPMRILKIIHGYPPDYNAGSEVYSQSICQELKRRHEVAVFTREENLYAPDFALRHTRESGIEFFRCNMAREKDGYRHAQLDRRLAEAVDAFRPDVAHIGHLNHLSTGMVAVLREKGIPILFTLHDFWLMCPRGQFLQVNFGNPDYHQLCGGQEDRKCATSCYNRFFSGLAGQESADAAYWTDWVARRMEATRDLAEQVDLFVAPSKYLMRRFVGDFGVPAERIVYADYGFPLHYLRPMPKRPAGSRFTFGYIGTHIPAKGVNLLIEAFSGLRQEASLRIWGRESGQSTKYLRQQAAGFDIAFMGEYVNHNLANEVFAHTDAIVVPSIWGENSPLVIHEAQACHIPVITADFGGMSEYVRHGVNGLLFRHRDADSLREQLAFAVAHPGLMEAYGRRGYLHHPQGQVPEIGEHCRMLEKFYHQILAQHGKYRDMAHHA